MAKTKMTSVLATILIAMFILVSPSPVSATLSPGLQRFDSSWFCGGKSRKMDDGCWKRLTNSNSPVMDGVSLREAADGPPPPQPGRSPPRK
ncbi:hypothetical protein ACS0TY_009062 [Phlomoides rotata]